MEKSKTEPDARIPEEAYPSFYP